jgi:hypothetical protein
MKNIGEGLISLSVLIVTLGVMSMSVVVGLALFGVLLVGLVLIAPIILFGMFSSWFTKLVFRI